MKTQWMLGALAAVLLGAAWAPGRADEVAQAGRAIAERWQDTVVSIELVTKTHTTMYGEESVEEKKSTVIGTVIDPSGLIVVSSSDTDPTEMLAAMFAANDLGDIKQTVEVVGTTVRWADGKETQAQVVLRDKDLDLAFVRPLKPLAAPVHPLDLTKAGTPEVFDQVIQLDRLGAPGNRALSLSLDRINAIIEKPRRLYVLWGKLGTPAFTLDGLPIGISVQRNLPSQKSGGFLDTMQYVVIPCADILEAAREVPAAQ